jgi:hypothetical protein
MGESEAQEAASGPKIEILKPEIPDQWVCEQVGLLRQGELAFQIFEARVAGAPWTKGSVEFMA